MREGEIDTESMRVEEGSEEYKSVIGELHVIRLFSNFNTLSINK